MNKFFKLSAVSMLAIMTATGANAAGYTCEELVEYTSCNPGYYLSEGGNGCPDGYAYGKGWCIYDGDINGRSGYTEQSCLDAMCDGDAECEADYDWIYLGDGCFKMSDEEPDYEFVASTGVTSKGCNECPIGSTCTGGTAGTTTCPAGSYCATAGLSQPTGKCNVGTYSTGGATSASCTSCPATGLTDKNGATVVATTSGTGSTSASACFVGNNVEFKDDKGIWHYKSECKHGNFPDVFPVEGICPDNYVGAYVDDEFSDERYCVYIPKEKCDEMHVLNEEYGVYDWTWDGSRCSCFNDGNIIYDTETGDITCAW